MRLRLCIALAAIATLAVPATADGYIFWMSYDSGKSRVGRAGLDASGVNPELVGNVYFGSAVATDGKYVYWGETGSSPKMASIGRATVDGGEINREFQTGATYCSPFAMRATASDIYWLKSDCSSGIINRRIDRAPNTGNASYSEPGGGSNVCGFDVDANYVYWSEGQYIARAPNTVPPQLPDKTWLDLGAGHAACGVAVDAGHVYWTTIAPSDPETFRADAIGRASIDGSEASVENDFIVNASFFVSISTPAGIDVDGGFLYWTNQPPANSVYGSIGRANLDGTGVKYDFIPNVFDPFGLDVEGSGPAPAPPSPGGKTQRPPPRPMRVGAALPSNVTFTPAQGSTPVRLSAGLASASKKVPQGTVFTYTLNQDAAVTVEMKRVKAGRLVGKKCKRPTKATAKKKKCDLTEHKLFRRGKEGKNTLPYSGRVKGKALRPSAYVAVFTATPSEGKPNSASARFRIVRP